MGALDSLGINLWSVLLHFVNIFSLVIILTFVLYKPLLKFLNERKSKITDSIEEIENLKTEFDEKLTEMKTERETLVHNFQEQMEKGQKELAEQKALLISEMQITREKLLDETQNALQDQKDKLVENVQKEVLSAMQKIVLTVLKAQMNEGTINQSIEDQWKKHLTHQS